MEPVIELVYEGLYMLRIELSFLVALAFLWVAGQSLSNKRVDPVKARKAPRPFMGRGAGGCSLPLSSSTCNGIVPSCCAGRLKHQGLLVMIVGHTLMQTIGLCSRGWCSCNKLLVSIGLDNSISCPGDVRE